MTAIDEAAREIPPDIAAEILRLKSEAAAMPVPPYDPLKQAHACLCAIRHVAKDIEQARKFADTGIAEAQQAVDARRHLASPGDAYQSALRDAIGLVESEANRWKSDPKTGEHWRKVADVLNGRDEAARIAGIIKQAQENVRPLIEQELASERAASHDRSFVMRSAALRQRVGELETMLADWGVVMGKEVGYPSAESMDRLRWAKEKVVLEARKLAAARQAGEGRTK
jgi:hypothetical protein